MTRAADETWCSCHDCIITGEGENDLIEGEFERGFREIGYRMKLECDIF